MTIPELKTKLVSSHAPQEWYSLTGGLPNEAYCIAKVEGGWSVYYSERGKQRKLKVFVSESDACDYFLALGGKYLGVNN